MHDSIRRVHHGYARVGARGETETKRNVFSPSAKTEVVLHVDSREHRQRQEGDQDFRRRQHGALFLGPQTAEREMKGQRTKKHIIPHLALGLNGLALAATLL